MKVEKIVSKRMIRPRSSGDKPWLGRQSDLFMQRWDGKWIAKDVNFVDVSDALVSPPWSLSGVVSVRTVPSSY